jgi:hypothetical protein
MILKTSFCNSKWEFGNIAAGMMAQMGFTINRLLQATNGNDIVPEF